MKFDILRESIPEKTFRVASILGQFDMQTQHIKERFVGSIEIENENYNIGVIVGNSGTGKSTIAKELFSEHYIYNYKYGNKAVIDEMPLYKNINDITKAFNSVGFSSPPSWLKPYSVLSNGEKMRVDLARAILDEKDLIIFDEFTSVVDRNIAKIASYAISKAIRRLNKKFIAVSCHFDILDWLEPDWIFDTNEMIFSKKKRVRPKINFKIYECPRSTWTMFKKYHYLDAQLNSSSKCFCGVIEGKITSFIAIIHCPHPVNKKIKRVHRLVVLPDYQGIGLGLKLLEFIGNLYKNQGYDFRIVTSSPALINSFKVNGKWGLTDFSRKKGTQIIGNKTNSANRITGSYKLK